MKRTIEELFEESRQQMVEEYKMPRELIHNNIFLEPGGKVTIPMGNARYEPVDIAELQSQYYLIVLSISEFHTMCRAISKDRETLLTWAEWAGR